jgi:hypothetical protein
MKFFTEKTTKNIPGVGEITFTYRCHIFPVMNAMFEHFGYHPVFDLVNDHPEYEKIIEFLNKNGQQIIQDYEKDMDIVEKWEKAQFA